MLTYGLVRSDQRIITPINMSLQEVYYQHVQAGEICGPTDLHTVMAMKIIVVHV